MTSEQIPKHMYITNDMIRYHGSTADCLKCRPVVEGNFSRHILPRSRACKERIMKGVGYDAVTRDCLSLAGERKTRNSAQLPQGTSSLDGGSDHLHESSSVGACASSFPGVGGAYTEKAQTKMASSSKSSGANPTTSDVPGSCECTVPTSNRVRAG